MENAYEMCKEALHESRILWIYTKARSMGKIVKELTKKYDITQKTVYKYLRRCLQGGSVEYALYNDFYMGNAIKNKVVTKHIGRKSTGAIKNYETGVIINDEMKKLFTLAICQWYEIKGGHSLKNTHKNLVNELFK